MVLDDVVAAYARRKREAAVLDFDDAAVSATYYDDGGAQVRSESF